jgi:predicted ATP-binding protein involved in virulence
MKVKRLTLRSFRGIDDLTLDFDSRINVLIGNNGVGKSSILECLATLLSYLIEKVQIFEGSRKLPRSSRRSLALQDITIGQEETHVEINILLDSRAATWSLSRARRGKEFEKEKLSALNNIINEIASDQLEDFDGIDLETLGIALTLQKLRVTPIENNPSLQAIVDDLCAQVEAGKASKLPLVIYYPVNRTVLDVPLRSSKNYSFEPITAYTAALTGGINFGVFFQWFRDREDLENERRTEDSNYRDNQLEAVRKSITALQPELSNLRVERSPLKMTVLKRDQELIIDQLSDGEKCLLAMVGDLARRLAIANPGLPDPLQGEGVVLIDEIELHLHPKWQREIIPALIRTFPNCQFIVTTHSPQVLGEVKGKVYQLKSTSEGIIAESLQTYGRDSNQILEDVMGVSERSPEFQDKLRKLFRLIEDGNLEEAKKLQQEFENLVKYDEPEFAKAEVLIRRKEVLGR